PGPAAPVAPAPAADAPATVAATVAAPPPPPAAAAKAPAGPPAKAKAAAAAALPASPGAEGRSAKALRAGLAERVSDLERQSMLGKWGATIRSRVARARQYPAAERAAGVTGTVVVTMRIATSGRLVSAAVARSSGSAALDAAALAAVRQAAIPAAPKGLGQGTFAFNLPVAFVR
ncbi:MAG: energy transducer TonB, partial [Rhodobacteraceae bacterium]|nr:energy transducer TonB [Paracoccaceae bacterium]